MAEAASAPVDNESEEWEVQRDENKSQGDTAFRSGNFEEAVTHYTNALSLDPTNYLILSNRSAAQLKLGNKSKALHDAQACVDANPNFVKGHSRLAAALLSLGRLEVAKSAYNSVLKLDPENAVAKKGVEDCSKLLRQKELEEQQRMQELLQKKEKDKEETQRANKQTETESNEEPKEEEDLLNDFFSEVENAVTAQKEERKVDTSAEDANRESAIKVQKTDLGTAQSQIERLLCPRFEWRNLNPFYVLDIPHTSSDETVSRRYKALSLLLHPDKCRGLERAKEAYDEVQRAKTHLDDKDKARHAQQLVEQGMKKGKHEWQANGEKESLEEVQSRNVQRIFAEVEFKRREVEKRQRKQEQREREQEEQELQKEKDERTFDKKWREEGRVDKRVGNWRNFQKKGSNKKPKM